MATMIEKMLKWISILTILYLGNEIWYFSNFVFNASNEQEHFFATLAWMMMITQYTPYIVLLSIILFLTRSA